MDSNGSKLSVPKPTKRFERAGKESIAKLFANAEQHKLTASRTLEKIEYGHGAPGTRYMQDLWTKRLDAFRTMILQQDLSVPFTGNDLIKFFDVMLGNTRRYSKDKPAPSYEMFMNALKTLIDYGKFTYERSSGYKIDSHDGARLMTFFDDAFRQGRLMKGNWQKKVWLTYVIVSRMTRAWLVHYHRHGTHSWDVVIAKHLSIVLITSLGSRAGDAARTQGYEGTQFMHWHHIKISLKSKEPRFEHLEMVVELANSKGQKDVNNKSQFLYFRPLAADQHMCPISLLLIHALRHGYVQGTTIEEVLQQAASTSNGRVKWLYPDRPVLSAFNTSGSIVILEKPAHASQPRLTIKAMGLIAGVLSRVYIHATRLGAAKDVAHLPILQKGTGVATLEVAQFLGHSARAFQGGVTEDYVGGSTREYYNERAENQYVDRRAPEFTSTDMHRAVKKRVSREEIEEWQRVNEPPGTDLQSERARSRAARYIRQQRFEDLLESCEGTSIEATKAPNVPKPSKRSKDVLAPKASMAPNNTPTTHEPRPSLPPTATTSHDDSDGGEFDMTLIDPQLLESAVVDPNEMETLEATLNYTAEDLTVSDETAAFFDHVVDIDDNADGDEFGDGENTASYKFINRYAKINCIRNENFAREWAQLKAGTILTFTGKCSNQGGSRDDPTPWMYRCEKTVGCTYTAQRIDTISAHERRCSGKRLSRKTEVATSGLSCTRDGCNVKFPDVKQRNQHVREAHEFIPVPCPIGCNPDRLYSNVQSYNLHMQTKHSGKWPMVCRVPTCDEKLNGPGQYANHLVYFHKLATAEDRKPYYVVKKSQSKQRGTPTCPDPGCQETFANWSGVKRHLVRIHRFSSDDATAVVSSPSTWTDLAAGAELRKAQEWREMPCPISGCQVKPLYKAQCTLKRHMGTVHKIGKQEAHTMILAYLVAHAPAEAQGNKRKRAAAYLSGEDGDEDAEEWGSLDPLTYSDAMALEEGNHF